MYASLTVLFGPIHEGHMKTQVMRQPFLFSDEVRNDGSTGAPCSPGWAYLNVELKPGM